MKDKMEASRDWKMDSSFVCLCDTLKLTCETRTQSWELWLSVKPEVEHDVDMTGFHCCCIYIKTTESKFTTVTISDIIRSANIHVRKLFSCMRQLRGVKNLISESVTLRFMAQEKRYCVSLALYHQLQQLLGSVFHEDEIPLNAPNDQAIIKLMNAEGVDYKRKLTWLLFLLASDSVNSGCELVLAYHILLCCLDTVIRASPTFQLKPPFDELKDSVAGEEDEDNGSILRHLYDPGVNSVDEVLALQCGGVNPFLQSIQTGDCTFDMTQLEDKYIESYKESGGINELLFLTNDASIMPKEITSVRVDKGLNSSVPVTPIKAALTSVQSLKTLVNTSSDTPSPTLQTYFDNCTQNPTEAVLQRVDALREKFIVAFTNASNKKTDNVARHRYRQAVRLYYRTLQAVMVMEEERLCEKNFTALLNKEVFHTSLIACCVEIILTTYSVSWNTSKQVMDSGESDFAFPWILNMFELKAFFFYKVLESVIKAEPCLPKNIIRHLQGVENTILECVAWQEDSPLFDVVSTMEPAQPSITADVTATSHSTPPRPSTSELYASPVVNRYPHKACVKGDNLSTASIGQSTGETTCSVSPRKSQSLTLFFNKVCRLGFHRLKALCTILNINQDLQHKIWTCLEHCITKRPDLLKNRHLDQMLLCSVYALCKVVEMEIKFKTIVNVYKDLPHASILTYREVYISAGHSDSIITFYNKIFSQVMKLFILQFSKNRGLSPTLSPVPKTLNSPSTSCYSLPGRPHFRVSPMKSPFKPPMSPTQMTPKSRVLYCFGEGLGIGERSGEKLRQINESMAEVKRVSELCVGRESRSTKKLKFDSPVMARNVEMSVPVVTRTPLTPEKKKLPN